MGCYQGQIAGSQQPSKSTHPDSSLPYPSSDLWSSYYYTQPLAIKMYAQMRSWSPRVNLVGQRSAAVTNQQLFLAPVTPIDLCKVTMRKYVKYFGHISGIE